MIHFCSLISSASVCCRPLGCFFSVRHKKADHPKWKGLCIFTSEEFDMECCLVWSCFLCRLLPSRLYMEILQHYSKNDLSQQTKRGLYLTCFHIFQRLRTCVCVRVCPWVLLSNPVKVCPICWKQGMTKRHAFGSHCHFTISLFFTWRQLLSHLDSA